MSQLISLESLFNKVAEAVIIKWQKISHLGVKYCLSEEEEHQIILANRINGILMLLLCVNAILQAIVNKRFTNYNAYSTLVVTILNAVLSGKGFHRLSKLSLCILPLFLLLFFNIFIGQVSNRPFLWYVYAVICFSIIPHLVFSFKTEKIAYIFTELYFFLLLFLSEYVLLQYSKQDLAIAPIIKADFFTIKSIQFTIYIFLNLLILYYLHLTRKQAKQLLLANIELNVTNDNLNKTNYKLEQYRSNLEEMVSTRTKALHESESRIKSIGNNFTAGMIFQLIYIGGKRKFTYLSNSVIKLYNITPEEGMADASLIYNKVHEDDISYLTKAEIEAYKTLSTFRAEVRIKDTSGGVRWSTFVSSPRILDDGSTCWDGIEFVTTERKEAEEILRLSESKYRRLHKSMMDGFSFVNMDGKIIDFNESFQQMLGYETEELLNLTYEDLTPLKWYQYEQQIINDQIIPYGFSEVYQKEYRRKDGTIFPIELRTYLLKNDVGENEGMWAIVRDVSEKKETERRILHAIIEAEERERNYFAREIHDGLGPLLSTVRLYLQWLNKPDLKASKDDLLAKADLVIEDAIASAREISHKLSPQILINFGLAPAVNNFIGRIIATTQTVINFESNIEIRLNNDIEITLYRVITECLNNSLKYANAKNIDIKLKVSDRSVHMIYTDNGIGFNVSEKIIEGKGLGLNNIQNRVTTLGGTFSIESKKNKGVRIEVQINT